MKTLLMLAIVAALIAGACTKDIKLDLKSTSSVLVIDAGINDQPGPYYVHLSKSVAYYDSNKIIQQSGGVILLSDDAGNRDSLIEIAPGSYRTNTILGMSGRTYHLEVRVDGRIYEAYSTMPSTIPIDSIYETNQSLFGRSARLCYGVISDPANLVNYYRGLLYINGKRQSKITVINDKLNDGKIISGAVRGDNDIKLGDTLQLELQCIDKPIYDYLYTLNNSTLSGTTAAPTNPLSNISGGALGYFSLHTSSYSKTVIVTQ